MYVVSLNIPKSLVEVLVRGHLMGTEIVALLKELSSARVQFSGTYSTLVTLNDVTVEQFMIAEVKRAAEEGRNNQLQLVVLFVESPNGPTIEIADNLCNIYRGIGIQCRIVFSLREAEEMLRSL